MSSSRGPVRSSSSRLCHSPRGLTHSLTRNTCLICALALCSTDSASFICGVGVLSAPICVLEFLGMFCHLCFWTRYPWARFWVQLEFFIFFFFPSGENLGKSKNYDIGMKPLNESRDAIPTTGESLSKRKGTQPEPLDGCSQSPWSKLNPTLVYTFSCVV